MKLNSLTPRLSRGKRLGILAGAAVLVIALAILLGGCVTITNVQLNGNVVASSNHLMSLTLTATTNSGGPVRGVFAIRIPSAWDVKTVSFAGALGGVATRSTAMENVYATEWEAVAPNAGHNGPKPGYKWWVGYSAASTWTTGQQSTVTIAIDTHGRGGTYYLDFATGITEQADPTNLSNKGLWQIGSTGSPPTGVLLDQAITLYAFQDVQPGFPYYTAIQGIGALGVVSGYPTAGGVNEFRPENNVKRAQYCKFIVNALNAAGVPGFTVNEAMAMPVNFPDLGPDITVGEDMLYPHEFVWTAYNHQIIFGYDDGLFRPYIDISRAHVITMTVRALQGLAATPLTNPPPGYVGPLGWGNGMLPEHMANARIAEFNGLLTGIPASSAANGNASMPRQEVAQVMWNMINLITGP